MPYHNFGMVGFRVNGRSETIAGQWVEAPKIGLDRAFGSMKKSTETLVLPRIISGQHRPDDRKLRQGSGLKLQAWVCIGRLRR
jgi:hypothetical protein